MVFNQNLWLRRNSDVKPAFSDNTWEQIIAACQSKSVPRTWKIGDQKAMTINGTEYLIDIIGKDHDDYSDGSGKAPLTFQMHDCYSRTYNMHSSNTNTIGWTDCAMRKTNLPDILALMPSEVKAGIRAVSKLTSKGSYSSTINKTDDKLFLLSEIEVIGKTKMSFAGEGEQYEYYAAGNSVVKKSSNSNQWSLRSPVFSSNAYFVLVNGTGDTTHNNPTGFFGVAFAFCF